MKNCYKFFSIILSLCLFISVICVPVSAKDTYNSRADFLWGVNIHPASYPEYSLDPELYVKASAELGVDTIRVNIGANINDFSYVDRIVALCSSYNLKIIACVALSDDLDYNRRYYEALCRRYNDKSGYGFIDYIEVGGEEEVKLLLNKYPVNGPTGDSLDHYYMEDVLNLKNKYASAIEGVKKSGTAAKTVIDFSHLHYAPLLYMYQTGLEFDVIGIDWYTNMGSLTTVLNPVLEKFPHDVIITETNLWSSPTTNFQNLNEYNLLFNYMGTAYDTSRVKGLIFYELVDETSFESSGTFDTEAHFGLLYSLNQNSVMPKPVYTYIQSVIGGGNIDPEPVINKEYRALIDLEGTHNSFAGGSDWFYHYLGDIHAKSNLAPADLSDSKYIELDIKIGDIEALKNAFNTYNLNMWFRVASGENIYTNSNAINLKFQDFLSLGNNWYHIKMPIAEFNRVEEGPIDWGNILHWQFFIEGGNDNKIDKLYSMDFFIRNICGTTPPPEMPQNATHILDEKGVLNTLGERYIDVYSRFHKVGFEAVDLTNADHIEFDMQFSSHQKLIEAIEKTGVRLDFSVTSSGQIWQSRWVAVNILDFCEYSGYGWYHFKIPKTAFGNSGGGGVIDWSNVNSWVITFEYSNGISTDEYCGITMNIKNICATARNTPSASNNSIMLDEEGFINTIDDYYHYLWDRLLKRVPIKADFSKADYIEFDLYYSDYNAVKSAVNSQGYTFCFNLSSSENLWDNRSFTGSIFNYETSLADGWYHYKIPKSAFYGNVNWKEVNLWMFGFNGSSAASPVFTGNLSNISITVKNVCGTVYKLVSEQYIVSKGYIVVDEGTSVDSLSKAFLTGADVYVGTEALATGIAATGMTVAIGSNGKIYDSATVIVNNDVYCDGFVNSLDLALLKKYLFGFTTFTEPQNVALTGSGNVKPTILNFIKIKKQAENII